MLQISFTFQLYFLPTLLSQFVGGLTLIPFSVNWLFRWFAKRFLHPDIVSIYDYIFLWDEDLGVRHFHPGRYISVFVTPQS